MELKVKQRPSKAKVQAGAGRVKSEPCWKLGLLYPVDLVGYYSQLVWHLKGIMGRPSNGHSAHTHTHTADKAD